MANTKQVLPQGKRRNDREFCKLQVNRNAGSGICRIQMLCSGWSRKKLRNKTNLIQIQINFKLLAGLECYAELDLENQWWENFNFDSNLIESKSVGWISDQPDR